LELIASGVIENLNPIVPAVSYVDAIVATNGDSIWCVELSVPISIGAKRKLPRARVVKYRHGEWAKIAVSMSHIDISDAVQCKVEWLMRPDAITDLE
jgi:hypothetical protein